MLSSACLFPPEPSIGFKVIPRKTTIPTIPWQIPVSNISFTIHLTTLRFYTSIHGKWVKLCFSTSSLVGHFGSFNILVTSSSFSRTTCCTWLTIHLVHNTVNPFIVSVAIFPICHHINFIQIGLFNDGLADSSFCLALNKTT